MINKTGYQTAPQAGTHTSRVTEMQELPAATQESESLAKVSLRSREMMDHCQQAETVPGLTNATQLRTPLPKRTQEVLELMKTPIKALSKVSASTAKASLK